MSGDILSGTQNKENKDSLFCQPKTKKIQNFGGINIFCRQKTKKPNWLLANVWRQEKGDVKINKSLH